MPYKPQFELARTSALLTSFNPRAEKHGEDPQPAADLRFAMNLPSSDLAMLDPTLRSLLFCKDPDRRGDLADQGTEAPHLRFSKLKGPLDWEHDIVGAQLTVHYGTGGKSDIVIEGCNVNKFSIDPQEGGTVIFGFRVQCHPTEQQNGKLSYMIQTNVEVSLTPPEEKADLADQGTQPSKGRGRKRQTEDATA